MRRTPSLHEAAEAPRCVSAIAYNTCSGERALQFRAPSLLQLPRCAAADTTWPKEKKTRRRDSAAGHTKVWPQKEKKLDANQSCGRRLLYVQG